jgi:hypothetical protein
LKNSKGYYSVYAKRVYEWHRLIPLRPGGPQMMVRSMA